MDDPGGAARGSRRARARNLTPGYNDLLRRRPDIRRVPGGREELVERALRFVRPLKDIFTPIWLGPSHRHAVGVESG